MTSREAVLKAELIKLLRYPVFDIKIQADKKKGYCFACGAESAFDYVEIITDELAEQWEVDYKSRHAYSSRESRQCKSCGATHRNRQMARAICSVYKKNSSAKNLAELVQDVSFRKLQVTEVNACGGIHQFLIKHPHMIYSEYLPEDKNIRSENLHALTYPDSSFDLVLDSDTLEHVPNYKLALREIHRVLKPSGKHIFTIPLLWDRKTRRRAKFDKTEKINYLVAPAYHGSSHDNNLVWTDFGYDILNDLDGAGFKTKVLYYNVVNPNDAGCVFVSTKIG